VFAGSIRLVQIRLVDNDGLVAEIEKDQARNAGVQRGREG